MQRRIHTRISTSNQVRRNGERKIVQNGSVLPTMLELLLSEIIQI